MKTFRSWTMILAGQVMLSAAAAAGPDPVLPTTTAPIVYTISYTDAYFKKPGYIEQFKAAPPDLLHVGKAVPISHLWGPTRLYYGENQYTGGPGHTLSWENIALLTPEKLAERIENIRKTLDRYHGIGIREITPYISYHTLAGDHQKRQGFWKFHDNWDTYAKWAGPRLPNDPFDWLVVDVKGKFVGGSCGGYSPDYFAPLHRYRACINHPDWAEWHRRLIRMVAEVGYDGCFIDNTHPDPCYCPHCKTSFRKFLDENRQLDWVGRLSEGLEPDKLRLDSPEVPKELVRRWRALRTGDHMGMIRDAGRKLKPGFTIFPNSGNVRECLIVGGQCDRLMFESTFSPGVLAAGELPESGEIAVVVSAVPAGSKHYTHRFELNDNTTFMEMEADVTVPTVAQVGKPAKVVVKIHSVGASLADGDAAEDFHILLRQPGTGQQVRLELQPDGPIGGTGSSRKPKQPPAVLKATWTPEKPGRYLVHFGFRYTDDGHVPGTKLRPFLCRLVGDQACRTHQAELLFTQHMHARTIYLGYEASKSGWENVQDLAIAEMAAFSGGGGFSGRGGPQAKYREFFKRHPQLFDGWRQTAPAAVLYSYWSRNPLATHRMSGRSTVHHELGGSHRLFVALVDANLPEKPGDLTEFDVIYLQSPNYEMSPAQLSALSDYAKGDGRLILAKDLVTINGRPACDLLGKVTLWDWADPPVPTPAIAPLDGLRRNLRFALYRKGDRLALHAVNYNVCLLDDAKKVLNVQPTPVEVPLPSGWTAATATCFDPDAEPATLDCTVADGTARLILQKIHIYKVVLLEKR